MLQGCRGWANDEDLVAEILKGSQEHFELLYEAYFPRVYRFALKRLKDPGDAEDVTQEVFITVFSALPSYQGSKLDSVGRSRTSSVFCHRRR